VGLLLSTTAVHAENLSPNLKFNGFASAVVSVSDDDQGGDYIADLYGYPGISETANAGLESLIGVQFDYQINDKTNVVTQIVAQGRNNYDANAEWAYISYKFSDQLRLRAGRFALPLFMLSDTINVGQSYPWARLPQEAYNGVPLSNFNGVDLLYRKPLGEWNLDAQVVAGESSTKTFRTNNLVGGNVSLSNGTFTGRVGVHQTQLTMDMTQMTTACVNQTATITALGLPASFIPILAGYCKYEDKKSVFANAGFQFDNGQWFAAAEVSQLEVDGWLNDWRGGYVSVGHYVGKLLPYVQWSKIDSYNSKDCTPFAPFCTTATFYDEQTTVAVGAKYALANNVSLKGQFDHIGNFNGTRGLTGGMPTPPKDFNVFTLGLTASF
jgi:hypothetical protein